MTSQSKSLSVSIVGYSIVLGGLLVKIPQIIKILKNKSVHGIHPATFSLEIYVQTIQTLYHYVHHLPFSTYGDFVCMGTANWILALLYQKYSKKRKKKKNFILIIISYLLVCIVLLRLHKKYPSILIGLQTTVIPCYIISRLPQILKNFREKRIGNLSLSTFVLHLLGGIGRIYTAEDYLLLIIYSTSVLVNGIICGQILYKEGLSL